MTQRQWVSVVKRLFQQKCFQAPNWKLPATVKRQRRLAGCSTAEARQHWTHGRQLFWVAFDVRPASETTLTAVATAIHTTSTFWNRTHGLITRRINYLIVCDPFTSSLISFPFDRWSTSCCIAKNSHRSTSALRRLLSSSVLTHYSNSNWCSIASATTATW